MDDTCRSRRDSGTEPGRSYARSTDVAERPRPDDPGGDEDVPEEREIEEGGTADREREQPDGA